MDYNITLKTLKANIEHFEGRIKTLVIRKKEIQESLNGTLKLKDFIRLPTLALVRKEHEDKIADIDNDIKEYALNIKSINDNIIKYDIENLFSDDILATLPNDVYILKHGYKLEFINDCLKLVVKGKFHRPIYNVIQCKVNAYNEFNAR